MNIFVLHFGNFWNFLTGPELLAPQVRLKWETLPLLFSSWNNAKCKFALISPSIRSEFPASDIMDMKITCEGRQIEAVKMIYGQSTGRCLRPARVSWPSSKLNWSPFVNAIEKLVYGNQYIHLSLCLSASLTVPIVSLCRFLWLLFGKYCNGES